MASFVEYGELLNNIAEAVGADPSLIRRIVVDVQIGHPVFVFIESFGSKQLLNVNWAGDLKDTQVVVTNLGSEKKG